MPIANGGTGFSSVGSSGTVLTSNGSSLVFSPLSVSNLKTVIYTSSTTWTVPNGVTNVFVLVAGAGGGGGSYNASAGTFGSSGGTGGMAVGFYTVTPSSNITITVGAGGAGNNSGTGGAGGSSSFGAFCSATGGTGGIANSGGGGSDGTGVGGNIRTGGTASEVGYFVGNSNNPTGSSTPVVWSPTSTLYGAYGRGRDINTNASASGGTSGIVFLQYVG